MKRRIGETARWRLPITVLASSFVLLPSSFASDATIELPKDEKQIPIIEPQPAKEDSLDRLKKLFPKKQGEQVGPTDKTEQLPEAGGEPQSILGKTIHQLKDHNWQQNVNIRIGHFTILGYRDATNATDKMLFRFLTREEHAEKRVMNSKASLLYSPRRNKPSECGGLTPPSSARLDAPKD